jgi:hypothetical protein
MIGPQWTGVERAIPDSLAEKAWLGEPRRLPLDLCAGPSPAVRREPMSRTRTRLDPRLGSARPRLPGANEQARRGTGGLFGEARMQFGRGDRTDAKTNLGQGFPEGRRARSRTSHARRTMRTRTPRAVRERVERDAVRSVVGPAWRPRSAVKERAARRPRCATAAPLGPARVSALAGPAAVPATVLRDRGEQERVPVWACAFRCTFVTQSREV